MTCDVLWLEYWFYAADEWTLSWRLYRIPKSWDQMEGGFFSKFLSWAKCIDIVSKTKMLKNKWKPEFTYNSEKNIWSLTQSQRLADSKG